DARSLRPSSFGLARQVAQASRLHQSGEAGGTPALPSCRQHSRLARQTKRPWESDSLLRLLDHVVAALAVRIERGGVHHEQRGLNRVAQLDQLAREPAAAIEILHFFAQLE